jgi:putative membrane protein
MVGFLGGDGYLWVKALHIIAVIAWMAGMLYLPRLYVYHCTAEAGSVQSETFKVMERRLLRAITNPAMIASWVLGLLLAAHLDAWGETWFQGKLALLLGMQLIHAGYARWRRQRGLLPGHERGADRADDRHRDPGGGRAVLVPTFRVE